MNSLRHQNPDRNTEHADAKMQSTPAALEDSLADFIDPILCLNRLGELGYTERYKSTDDVFNYRHFFCDTTQTSIVLTDSIFSATDQNTQGSFCVLPYEDKTVLGAVIPVPSLANLSRYLGLATSPDRQLKMLEFASSLGQLESLNHEIIHINQVLNQTPWGTALVAPILQNFIAELARDGYPVKVSGFLEAFVGGALPTQEQTIAGTLISEICAHGENSAVLPELAEIAIRTRSQITEALATDRSEKGIKDALSRWNQIYHTYRYPLASEAAIEVAVAWLIEQGKIQ